MLETKSEKMPKTRKPHIRSRYGRFGTFCMKFPLYQERMIASLLRKAIRIMSDSKEESAI